MELSMMRSVIRFASVPSTLASRSAVRITSHGDDPGSAKGASVSVRRSLERECPHLLDQLK
jgi:hypothetical protein